MSDDRPRGKNYVTMTSYVIIGATGTTETKTERSNEKWKSENLAFNCSYRQHYNMSNKQLHIQISEINRISSNSPVQILFSRA